MNKVEYNIQTGERKIVEFTQADIDKAAAVATEYAALNAEIDLRETAIDAMLAKEALDPLAPQEVKDYVNSEPK